MRRRWIASLLVLAAWRDARTADLPRCALPPRDCVGTAEHCGALTRFAPERGPGYEDVPLDDEVSPRDSTSYVRRDLRMVVQYAAAKVACLASTWTPGNGGPLALGDMSDRTGSIPGSGRGVPRHPPGTHVDGRDIDLGYFQTGTPDNHLRPICPHVVDGVDQRRCVGAPSRLDARRTALLIGALFESRHVRVVGVDGAAAPSIEAALRDLCAARVIPGDACGRVRLGRETADTGRGWFHAHHNHLHVAWQAWQEE